MKWRRIAIVHENSYYSKDFNDEFVKRIDDQPLNEKICIQANLEIPYHYPNNWNQTLDILEASGAKMILLLMDFPQTSQFFSAASNRLTWTNGKFQFIGIDAWSNQLDFSIYSKPLIVNSITSQLYSPIWEPFREHLKTLTLNIVLKNAKPNFCLDIGNYSPIADMIKNQNNCTQTHCTGNETLQNVAEGTLIKVTKSKSLIF